MTPRCGAEQNRCREGDGRFEVEGELDVSNAEQLGEALWAGLRAASSVAVDLSGLAFMDSQGLRLFLQLARRLPPCWLPSRT